jgi:hypothetical protein
MAARWTTPASSTPAYKAMKMYRNYDGNRSTFGETSIAATTADPDTIAAFAAQRSDGALTVMLISKYLTAATPATVNLAGFQPGGTAQVWQLTSANTIGRLPDIGVGGSSLSLSLPPQSVTLVVVAASASAPTAPTNLRITK